MGLRALASCLLALCFAPGAADAAGFQVLYRPDGVTPGVPNAISRDGRVIVGHCGGAPCRWDDGVVATPMQTVAPSVSPQATLSAISDDGAVIVGSGFSSPGLEQAVVWRGTEVSEVLLPGRATAVSGDGRVVAGTSFETETARSFIRVEGSPPVLVPGGERLSFVDALSHDGSVMVGYGNFGPGRLHPSRWESGVLVDLGLLPSAMQWTGGNAHDVTPDGAVVVGSSSSYGSVEPGSPYSCCREAFRLDAGSMAGLGELRGGSYASYALAVSSDGSVVVGQGAEVGGDVAMIWDAENGMRAVPHLLADEYGAALPPLGQTSAQDVSGDGRILIGWSSNGVGWRAELASLCSDGLDSDRDGLVDFPADPGCASAADWSERGPDRPCDDGADGDGDGFADAPEDPGCTNAADLDERDAAAPCDDGIDGDGDGLIDVPADPGCSDPADPSERSASLPCDDGVDDDDDGLTDFPADPGCATPSSSAEDPACDNGVDDDGDGRADALDPGCAAPSDESERSPTFPCDDGLDNDGDGLVDYPQDPGCASAEHFENPPCSNGWDDDADGLVDHPDDPGCASPSGDIEDPMCSNGRDDDWDGATDYPEDSGCRSAASYTEAPACSNGWDDDHDGTVDASGGADGAPADPECSGQPWRDRETRACGLGAEVAALLVVLRIVGRAARGERRRSDRPA